MPTVLVTGANRGIGLELCRQLKARGDSVIAACRKSSAELDGLGVRVEAGIEVTSDASVAELKKRLGDTKIDLLVNNAGIGEFTDPAKIDFERMRLEFEVNAVGPVRVTTALLPLLHKGSKVAIITSRMGSMQDNTSGGYYSYRMSKAAVNAAGVSLAHDLKDKGIAVVLLHPGMVGTDMTGGQGIKPADAVTGLLARIDALSVSNTGRFLHAKSGEELPW
jgi:NAD(P)-dependent dehydrogenase (short-subunit alcohol dehydrogenase family)